MSDEIDRLIEVHGHARVLEALLPCLSDDRIARIDEVLDARLDSVTAIVEDVYDPHNAAAAIRSCEGLGVHTLHVVEREHTFAASKGVTIGGHRWMQLARWPQVADCAAALRARGYTVWGTLPGAAQSIETIDVSRPVAVVFGNERVGMSEEAIAACDGAVGIPMFGMSQSFNLSVSVALVMNRLTTRRRALLGAVGDLPAEVKDRLRARWVALKIRGAASIVERAVSAATRPDVALGPQSGENSRETVELDES
ncbi:MAG: RNA methyltransferase [Deltaproteobacteria bacterium]|nr:RNA methyltransferase [Deltaproteobacteria bacterium]